MSTRWGRRRGSEWCHLDALSWIYGLADAMLELLWLPGIATNTHCFDQCRLTKLQHSSAASTISFFSVLVESPFGLNPPVVNCCRAPRATSSRQALTKPEASEVKEPKAQLEESASAQLAQGRARRWSFGMAFFGMCACVKIGCVKIGKTPQMEVSFGFSVSLKSTNLFLFLEEHRTSKGTRGLRIPCSGR